MVTTNPGQSAINAANSERVRVVSLLTTVASQESLIESIARMAENRKRGYVCVSTVHMVMEAYDSQEFKSIVNGADLVITDGMPLVWMQKLQGASNAERTRGNDLMSGLFCEAEKRGLSVGFYGGKPEVLDKLAKKAAGEYPALDVVYQHAPPFRPLETIEEKAVIADINKLAPDILFVGLGCPKQEKWMFHNKERLNTVMIGIGAALDFYAGNIPEAPEWLQKLGLEWLYRLSQEPGRLWKRYLILNPRFLVLAAGQLLGIGSESADKQE